MTIINPELIQMNAESDKEVKKLLAEHGDKMCPEALLLYSSVVSPFLHAVNKMHVDEMDPETAQVETAKLAATMLVEVLRRTVTPGTPQELFASRVGVIITAFDEALIAGIVDTMGVDLAAHAARGTSH